MLHGAAITGDKEMLQKLLKSSYFDKSAIDIRHCVIFFRLLCPLKNQNYPDHGGEIIIVEVKMQRLKNTQWNLKYKLAKNSKKNKFLL